MHDFRWFTAAAALVALTACRPQGASAPHAGQGPEIPITRVVLYQNGVGYFERRGRISGDALTLQIRPNQINDLLKSLTVIDQSEGRAVSVSLPMEKTGAQVLSELPEQVRNASGLLDVLRVFRGARIAVHGSEGDVTGRIVGVENMQANASGEDVKADWRLTIKTDNNRLRVYAVDAISRIDLEDRTLSVGLDQSLDVSLNEGNWKPIALSIGLAGHKQHDLTASYIVEMPRWKPAYRLVAGENGLLLQGWAVVDNISGEDWNRVSLSLVAGQPISFIYDLHTPEFTQRPDLTPRGRQVALAPPTDQPGNVASTPAPAAERARRPASHRASRSAGGRAAAPSAKADNMWDKDEESAGYGDTAPAEPLDVQLERQEARVQGATVGSLFRYDLQDPVTVPDRSSTLVAIINKRVPGGDVVLFRPNGPQETHPYRAVMFKNESGFALEKGPVTIYSGGTFVGEGFIERMEKSTTAFVSYAMDGNVSMVSHNGTRNEGLRLLKIVDGMVLSEVLQIQATTYEVTNRHPAPITAYVKTARRTGWKLQHQPADTIVTPDALMVPVVVPANGKAKLDIEWAHKIQRRERFDSQISMNLLDVYLESGKAPPAVARVLTQAIKLKGQMNDVNKEMARKRKLHDDLSRDQDRVRANLTMLGKTKGNADLRRQLEKKLADQEKDLGQLSGDLVRLSEQRADLDKKLTVLIRSINLSAE